MRIGVPPGPLRHIVRPEPFFFSKLARALTDVALWVLAVLAAFLLRYDMSLPDGIAPAIVTTTLVMVGLQLVATLAFQLHRQNWTKASFRDARVIAIAMACAALASALLLAIIAPTSNVPLSIPLVAGVLSGAAMLITRGGVRYIDDHRRSILVPGKKRRNVLVIGAGDAGTLLVREMQRHPESGLFPVAFLDSDLAKIGRTISRVPVVGDIDQLERFLEEDVVDEVLIAIPSADGGVIRRIVETIRSVRPRLPYRTMPSLNDLLAGNVTVSRVREVGIEDLLQRPPIKLDTDSILSYLQNKTVMVTGAGGSIGSELIRQICRFGPKKLILFGHGENSIYQFERELDRTWPDVSYRSVIGAVQNVARLDHIFKTLRPDVVFHAAAHKHVPLMELNPEEAVFNNVVGSRNLVNLCLTHGVSHFVNISTDKAVNPTSVMGASKRMVELIVEQASRLAAPGQVFTSVRFGNVLGSRGSAVPIFKQQIKDGGPVTITHPDMVRYFMTIPEATQLVLQASALGRNGEIFILDMGEPIKVVDLVKDLIRLSGLEPDVDIAIEYTGVRPGEKMIEELMTDGERHSETEHEKIFVARPTAQDPEQLDHVLEVLIEAAMRSDGAEIRRLLGVGGPSPAFGVERLRGKSESGESPALRPVDSLN